MAEETEVIKKCGHILSNNAFTLGCGHDYCTLEDLHDFSESQMNIKKEDSISCGSDYDDILDDDEHYLQAPTEVVTSDCESIQPEIYVIKIESGSETIDARFCSSTVENQLDEFYQNEQIDEKQPKLNYNSGLENQNNTEPTKRIRKRTEKSLPLQTTNRKTVSSKLNNNEPNPITTLVARRDRRNRIRYKNHKCSFCSKVFVDKRNRSDHENTHTGKRPYECQICTKTFAAYAALKRHTNTHTGERPYHCSACKQQFSQKTLLDIHTREQHLSDTDPRRYFPCKLCDAKLKTYGQMIHHKRKHQTNHPIFVCDYCQKQFTAKPTLIAHMTIHSGRLPYKCKFCVQTFARRCDKNRHEKICFNKLPK